MLRLKIISAVIGVAAMVGLFLFYALTMKVLAGSWDAVWWQWRELWYLMLPLMAGFGIQAGLFYYIKSLRRKMSAKMMAVNSATSTVGMIACCVHHAVDFVPLLGLTALTLWLTAYQKPLLTVGIISNFAGIVYLVRVRTLLFLDKSKVV